MYYNPRIAMNRSSKRILFALAAVFLPALPLFPQKQPAAPATQRAEKSKKGKARELPRAPDSELISRILEEEARLDTARRLSAEAKSTDEKQLAQKAVRLADHELDLAFLVALRRAADNPEPPTPQVAELESTVKQLQAEVDSQQAVVDGLKNPAAKVHGQQKDALQDRLDMEEAKLELASDELADAREDLINAGGDLKAQIERLQDEHKATEQSGAAPNSSAAGASGFGGSETMLGHLSLWLSLHGLRGQLEAAQADAGGAVETLQQRMEAAEKELGAQTSAPAPPAGQSPAQKPAVNSGQSGSMSLEMLKRLSRNQKILAGYKLRMRDLTELAAAYGKWDALEAARQREATRSLVFSALWIALIVLVGIISNRVLHRLFERMTEDRRRLHTLRTLSRFGVQAFCLALILLVVLGPPSQLATLVAFAGAGLTVALKDFIVSFIGWFMLMGKNGVHAGDWVEINSVCGEVLEVNLFHTVMLETGAWNDPGHPTGRKVTFTNAYAIEGHYFNFTTSGQWLWDELEFLVPQGLHPNAMADSVLQMVTAETAPNAQLAEQEWNRLGAKAHAADSASPVSAAPVLNVRPSGSGIVGRIRYITRANERFQTRARLYHLIVEALHAPSSRA